MLVDNSLVFSAAQAVTSSAVSTNSVPSANIRDIGAGQTVHAHFDVDETVTASGSATVTFQLIGSANGDLSSPVVLLESAPIPKATLVAGYRFALPFPTLINSTGYKYYGVNYVVSTGPLTAGKFSAFLTTELQDMKFYPSGFSVQ